MLENRVRELRARFRWTQQDLADTIGVTRQTIGLIEKGDYNPTLSLCIAIAKELNQTLDSLFWEVE